MDQQQLADMLIQDIASFSFEEDYLLGIHLLLHAKSFDFIDKYDQDGKLFFRSAVLLNGLCHIFASDEFEGEYILALGQLPPFEECGMNNWQLNLKLDHLATTCLDIWEDFEEDEELILGTFSCFSMVKLTAAAESKQRIEIRPVLTAFMGIFGHYPDHFIEVADDCLGSNFDADTISDETLEAAFMDFIAFINENIIPKINLAILKPTPDTKLN